MVVAYCSAILFIAILVVTIKILRDHFSSRINIPNTDRLGVYSICIVSSIESLKRVLSITGAQFIEYTSINMDTIGHSYEIIIGSLLLLLLWQKQREYQNNIDKL